MTRELSESDVFVLLAERRRRLALQALREAATPLMTIELTRRIGDRACETPGPEDLHAIHLDLYHNHLPRLDDADVVTYDRDEGTVRPGPNFDALVRVLESVSDEAAPWAGE